MTTTLLFAKHVTSSIPNPPGPDVVPPMPSPGEPSPVPMPPAPPPEPVEPLATA
jgi:hypothetical protein